MRCALDATYALDPRPSGVARYSDRLIRELAQYSEIELTLCARWPRSLGLRRHFDGLHLESRLLWKPFNAKLAKTADLFHGLNQRLPASRFRRQVVTIHDVFPLTSEPYSSFEFRRKFSAVIADAVARADRIICVSSYTRDQLCGVLPVRPDICEVVHHGVEQCPAPPSIDAQYRARELAGEGPFFLCVGAMQVRKNTRSAVEAIGLLPAQSSVRLVIAGSAGHGAAEIMDFIARNGMSSRVRVLGYVDEGTLAGLYAQATALIFPSLEEGFGFPVLEAMARGVPVIASNASAIPEVAASAAILIDPHDTAGMAASATRLLEDEAWRADWIARGLARSREFTWKRAAQATLDVYRKLLLS